MSGKLVSISLWLFITSILIFGCGRRESPAAFDAPAENADALARAPRLPASAARVKWGETTMPGQVTPGSTTAVTVTFTNASDRVWPDKAAGDPSRRDGSHAVRLGYVWSRPSDPESQPDRRPARGELPNSLQPGESVTVGINVVAPQSPGEYVLEFDLVQELLFWFSGHGGDTLSVPVRVEAGTAASGPSGTR